MLTPEREEKIRELMRSELESYTNGDHDTPPYLSEAMVDLFEEIDRLRENLDIAIATIQDFKETFHSDFCLQMYDEDSGLHGDHCHYLDKSLKKLLRRK